METTRTEDTPWMVVDLMTNDVLGYYRDGKQHMAYYEFPDKAIDVQYRPKRKRKTGRSFP